MWDIAARSLASQSIVGDREAPARILRVVADQDFALRSGREAMLQAVDHELRHDQPEAHRFAGALPEVACTLIESARPSPIIDAARLAHSFVR